MEINHFGWSSPPTDVMDKYITKCGDFVENDELFANFKRDIDYTKILEGNEAQTAELALSSIKQKGGVQFALDNLERFRENEKIGNPVLLDVKGIDKPIAPSTIRYINTTLDIMRMLNGKKIKKIVEVGGGYGGLCKTLSVALDFDEYIIIDVPNASRLAEKYLSHFPELKGRVRCVSCEDMSSINNENIDLLIADSSIAECDLKTQLLYMENFGKKTPFIYLVYNTLHLDGWREYLLTLLVPFARYKYRLEDCMGVIILSFWKEE
jgi:putative sugar O-methyltransferase